jgi:biopolymer transport protein ExbD
MAFLKRQTEKGEGFNMTPLVDVMFILLIFIVVTAQYTNLQSLKVSLPKSESGGDISDNQNFVVTLTEDEKVYLNEDPISFEALRGKLESYAKQESPPRMDLRADKQSTTGSLVRVMDMASQVGLKKIFIDTKK